MNPARMLAAQTLAAAAERFPQLDALEPDPQALLQLDGRDGALLHAILRAAAQRWLTLEYLLNHFLTRQPLEALEPRLQGVLLTGAAQLLCLDRLPAHAVVHETVELARTQVRPGAAGLVNAIMRRLAQLIEQPVRGKPWTPHRARLPLDDGFIPLSEPILPDPAADPDDALALASSQPRALVAQLRTHYTAAQTQMICLHSIVNPPLTVAVEDGFDPQAWGAEGESWCQPHERPGFIVWRGPHEQLLNLLHSDGRRRVQDVSAAEAALLSQTLPAKVIIDYCAGRGTKSRQLALLHPRAQVLAWDRSSQRRRELAATRPSPPNLQVARTSQFTPGAADLLLLDVPCSNSAVLARRPEARYRHSPTGTAELVEIQRQIIRDAFAAVRPGGWVIYSTCSLLPAENQQQVQWLTQHFPVKPLKQQQTLPSGNGVTYQDGAFAALLQRHA